MIITYNIHIGDEFTEKKFDSLKDAVNYINNKLYMQYGMSEKTQDYWNEVYSKAIVYRETTSRDFIYIG